MPAVPSSRHRRCRHRYSRSLLRATEPLCQPRDGHINPPLPEYASWCASRNFVTDIRRRVYVRSVVPFSLKFVFPSFAFALNHRRRMTARIRACSAVPVCTTNGIVDEVRPVPPDVYASSSSRGDSTAARHHRVYPFLRQQYHPS